MFPFLATPPILQDGFDPITPSELHRATKAWGVSLPGVYAELLLRQNGGRFAQLTVGGVMAQTHIQCIYALNPGFEYNDLGRAVRTCQALVGEAYVPFGNSGLGRYLLVKNEVAADSAVFAFDYATNEIELVADGLTNLFQSLRYSEAQDSLWVETIPPFTSIERGEMPSLSDCGNLLEIRNEFGQTALACAAASLQPRMVEVLLELGANPNDRDDQGETPLMLGAKNDAYDVCRTLVAHGADVQLRNHDGMTALDLARRDENVRVTRLLTAGR